jgi:hypothetical protein
MCAAAGATSRLMTATGFEQCGQRVTAFATPLGTPLLVGTPFGLSFPVSTAVTGGGAAGRRPSRSLRKCQSATRHRGVQY